MKFKHRQLVAGMAVAVVVAASIVARNGSALPNLGTLLTLDDELTEFVRGAVQKNALAQSYEEWLGSGFTAADIIANAEARPNRKEALASLCRVLAKTPATDLALFQNELTDTRTRPQLPCRHKIASRLNAYWESQAASLQAESRSLHQKAELAAADQARPTLPCNEVSIDPSKGERLDGGQGRLSEGEVAIALDGGPHPSITREILAVLKTYGVRANFFNDGQPSRRWPELLKAEAKDGHVVGSHSQTRIAKIDMRGAEHEIMQARKQVSDAVGAPVAFFRFPYGSPSHVLGPFLKQQRMTSFGGELDSQDWKRADAADLLRSELAQLDRAKGGVLLLHENQRQTVIVLPHLLDEIRHRGWKTALFVAKRW